MVRSGSRTSSSTPLIGYASSGIDLRLGVSAQRIDPRAKLVELQGREGLAYDTLLVHRVSTHLARFIHT